MNQGCNAHAPMQTPVQDGPGQTHKGPPRWALSLRNPRAIRSRGGFP